MVEQNTFQEQKRDWVGWRHSLLQAQMEPQETGRGLFLSEELTWSDDSTESGYPHGGAGKGIKLREEDRETHQTEQLSPWVKPCLRPKPSGYWVNKLPSLLNPGI